jgi:hypothetical protein
MSKPTVVTVPTGFAWVVEEAIHAAVRRIHEMQQDAPAWLDDGEGQTMVVVLRNADATGAHDTPTLRQRVA